MSTMEKEKNDSKRRTVTMNEVDVHNGSTLELISYESGQRSSCANINEGYCNGNACILPFAVIL